ncbi:UNVERIFIED_CONTAM: hypothetical protein K2H54_049567 [Gekko kuhli]
MANPVGFVVFPIDIPDIVNCKHLKTFRDWDGDLKKLPNIKTRKLSSRDAVTPQVEEACVETEKERCTAKDIH